jgi:hypothetical protein
MLPTFATHSDAAAWRPYLGQHSHMSFSKVC